MISESSNRPRQMRALHMPFDQMNPYQRSLADALGRLGVQVEFQPIRWHVLNQMRSMDVLHLHWTTKLDNAPLSKFLLRLPWLAMQFILLRLLGRRIVWTVHNLENHERRNPLQQR